MDDTTWTDIAAVEGANVDGARPDTDGGVRSFLTTLAGISDERADAIVAEGYDALDGITNDLALDDLLALGLPKGTAKKVIRLIANAAVPAPAPAVPPAPAAREDATTTDDGGVAGEAPIGCVAVAIDRSGSMGGPFSTERTRMQAVGQAFYAFRDRAETVDDVGVRIGLIQFDDKVSTVLGLTDSFDAFGAIVDDLKPRACAAIYGSVVEGVRMLEPVAAADPAADLRVLVLTDGCNNAGPSPGDAVRAARRIGCVVDAIVVGDRPDGDLRRIVAATGGECWQIATLGDAFELMEAESVVSLRARRGGAPKPPHAWTDSDDEKLLADFRATAAAAMATATAAARARVAAPAIKSVVDVRVLVTQAQAAAGKAGKAGKAGTAGGNAASPYLTSGAQKRIMGELTKVAKGDPAVWLHSGEGIHVFPAGGRLDLWRCLIEGPAGSPFEGGVFALRVELPRGCPFKPPKVRFETPVYHCNVDGAGNLCMRVLREGWNPALSVPKALEAIRMLLREPDADDAMRQWIAEAAIAHKRSGGKDTRYADAARAATRKDAGRSVDEWRKVWGVQQRSQQ